MGLLGRQTELDADRLVWLEIGDPRSALALQWGSRPLDRGGWGFLIWFWLLVSIAIALPWHCVRIVGLLFLLVFLPPLFGGLFSYL